MALKYYEILTNPGTAPLAEIPVLDYDAFAEQTVTLLKKDPFHCVNYFTVFSDNLLIFYIVVANDDSHKLLVYSHIQPPDIRNLKSITESVPQMHVFERQISELTGIAFEGHPWLKPVRYPFNRKDQDHTMSDFPFYKIESEETHEVGVGPIHAGVIEPGHFRFLCHGEKVLHLEIQLGYQHRGVETLFEGRTGLLEKSVLAESIAGDTAIGHGIAFAQLCETLAGIKTDRKLEAERIIALEMERMAVHVGDTAALCGDVAYQIGQVTCEALRTMIINTTQDWCGNRFGKGLIRPGGTYYPLTPEIADHIRKILAEVNRRFMEATDLIFSNSGVLTRFEGTGHVSTRQALLAGAVGMAARSCGISRDIRKTHPFQSFRFQNYNPALMEQGDVFARAFLRVKEFELSYSCILELLAGLTTLYAGPENKPDYSLSFSREILGISLAEGWRGEICHTVVTGRDGFPVAWKVIDPSLHNWHVLALAVREQEISDFPVCNKSFNLSYCGNDL